jgi:serine/threonine protein kinase
MTLPNAKKRKIFDGRYEIIALVGRGSESVVYHARHINSPSHEVALKVLHSQTPNNRGSLTDRLRKEALTLVSCRHKFVVRLDDFHSVQDLCYLSMEYAHLGDLRKYLSAMGCSLSADQGQAFLRQTLEALDFVHATGVIHRDLKPDNILVINEQEVRLADFGLALLPGDDIDLEDLKRGVGSFAYLPPELLEGICYDTRSDLYGLGLCFYEALAGFHPFEKLPLAEQLDARRDNRLPLINEINPTIPSGLAHVIAKLMRFDPSQRFQNAAQAIKALSDPNFSSLDSEPQPAETALTSSAIDDLADFDPLPYPDEDVVDETIDISAQALVQDALEAAEPPSGRERQPTEEFDLERLKSLIEQDSTNKALVAERRSQLAPQTATKTEREEIASEAAKSQIEHFPLPGSLSRRTKSGASSLRSKATLPTRLATVILAAALGTIVLLATYSRFSGHELAEIDAQTDGGEEAEDAHISSEPTAPEPEKARFPRIGQGLYSGSISDLLPGSKTPLALISMPNRNSLVVIIGIPGWTPVEVTIPEDRSSKPDTVTVRSNGFILNVTGELAGESITGMFRNAITGETGPWSAQLVK